MIFDVDVLYCEFVRVLILIPFKYFLYFARVKKYCACIYAKIWCEKEANKFIY